METLHLSRSDDVVAYTYKNGILCPSCAVAALAPNLEDDRLDYPNVEIALDAIAATQGINRYNERSYRVDQFPKVIFRDEVEPGVVCGFCHSALDRSADDLALFLS